MELEAEVMKHNKWGGGGGNGGLGGKRRGREDKNKGRRGKKIPLEILQGKG